LERGEPHRRSVVDPPPPPDVAGDGDPTVATARR
jgi:hypothetical protein